MLYLSYRGEGSRASRWALELDVAISAIWLSTALNSIISYTTKKDHRRFLVHDPQKYKMNLQSEGVFLIPQGYAPKGMTKNRTS